MKKVILITFVIFLSLISFFIWLKNDINFYDNPAILLNVSKDGEVTLDTYSGKLIGNLYNVDWLNDSEFYESVLEIVTKAKVDKVAYSLKRNHDIEVWYQSNEGTQNLNDQIRNIKANLVKPQNK